MTFLPGSISKLIQQSNQVIKQDKQDLIAMDIKPSPQFSQYRLAASDLLNLSLISTHSITQQQKTKALIQGCLKRNSLQLYKGDKYFYQDLQLILDNDRVNAVNFMKSNKIAIISKENSAIACPQCRQCGKYTAVYKYCEECQHIHYCQISCEMNVKFTHQKQCQPRPYPNILKSLFVEVHFGSDLGQNVEIYYQHEARMTLKARGEAFLNKLLVNFTKGDDRLRVPEGFSISMKNCLQFKKKMEGYQSNTSTPITINSLEDVKKVYQSNPLLGLIEIALLREGAILWKYIQQVHNNHLHLIYIFICC